MFLIYKQGSKVPYQLWNSFVQINPTHKKLLYKEAEYQILCCPIFFKKTLKNYLI